MGEEPWRVFNVGDPALDRFAEIPKMARRQVLNYFGFKKTGDAAKPLILVIQHVISGEVDKAHDQMRATLEASTTIGANCVINYPNSDMGSRALMEVIEKYRELSNVRITKNVPRKVFVNLLRNINLLLGNSSMGFLEGCFLRIPAINVGSRNAERMNGGNVVFVKADAAAVKEIASRILTDKAYQNKLKNCRQLYGDGKTAKRIVSTLKKIKKSKSELTAKNITY